MSNSTDDRVTSPVQTTQYGWIWTGTGCAVMGNFLISLSFQMQRYAHVHNTKGAPYTTLPLWWFGLCCMAGGEIGNFLAYGMAPATLVSPLGAVTVISNAILSRVFLKETITWIGLGGVVFALFGAVLIALNAPAAEAGATEKGDARGPTPPERVIYDSLISWRAFTYLIIVLTLSFLIANPFNLKFAVSNEIRKKIAIFNCFLCGLMGAITVTSAKGISTAINQGLAGKAAMFAQGDICWLTYILIISAVGSIVLQMKFLNEALIHFGSGTVVPIYYIVFTSITISAGMCLFLEISFAPLVRSVILFSFGLFLAFIGVFLINSQKVPEVPSGDKESMQAATREELQALFQDLDVNRSGGVDANELDALASAVGEGSPEARQRFVKAMLNRADTNHSGFVDFEEFEKWYHDVYIAAKPAGDATAADGGLSSEQVKLLGNYARNVADKFKKASELVSAIGNQGSVVYNAVRVQKNLTATLQKEMGLQRGAQGLLVRAATVGSSAPSDCEPNVASPSQPPNPQPMRRFRSGGHAVINVLRSEAGGGSAPKSPASSKGHAAATPLAALPPVAKGPEAKGAEVNSASSSPPPAGSPPALQFSTAAPSASAALPAPAPSLDSPPQAPPPPAAGANLPVPPPPAPAASLPAPSPPAAGATLHPLAALTPASEGERLPVPLAPMPAEPAPAPTVVIGGSAAGGAAAMTATPHPAPTAPLSAAPTAAAGEWGKGEGGGGGSSAPLHHATHAAAAPAAASLVSVPAAAPSLGGGSDGVAAAAAAMREETPSAPAAEAGDGEATPSLAARPAPVLQQGSWAAAAEAARDGGERKTVPTLAV